MAANRLWERSFRVRRGAVWLVLAAVAGAVGAQTLDATSLEVGESGVYLRSGQARGLAEQAAFTTELPAEGNACVRLEVAPDEPAPALEWGWLTVDPGDELTLSVHLRGDRPGQRVRLALRDERAEPLAAVTFVVAATWRRYELSWTPPAGHARCYVEVLPASPDEHDDATVWVDALQLDRGAALPFTPPTELGVSLDRPHRLRLAGEGVGFHVRLRTPGADEPVPVTWRIDTGMGGVWRRGVRLLRPRAGLALDRIETPSLPPGAWRFVAEVSLGGQLLTASDHLVTVEPQLGDPLRWFGVLGVTSPEALSTLRSLRLGLLHGMLATPPAAGAQVELERVLLLARRDGVATMGVLPDDPGAARALYARWGSLVGWWQRPAEQIWRDVASDLPALRAVRGVAPSRLLGVRLRLDQAPVPRLRELAAAGGLALTDAVELALPPGGPPQDPAPALAEVRAALTAAGRPLPVWLRLPSWPGGSWSRPSEGAAARRQAAWLAQAIVLARAAGADGLLYPGLADGLARERLSLAWEGRLADLCDCAGRPLPGLAAVDCALDSLRGRRLLARVPSGSGVLMTWAGRRPLLTAWATKPGQALVLDLPAALLLAVDACGSPVRLRTERFVLPLDDGPVYVFPTEHGQRQALAAFGAAKMVPAAGTQ